MPLIVHKSGVLVESTQKVFEDGTSGFYCQIVIEDGSIVAFWAPEDVASELGEVMEVEGWSQAKSRVYTLRLKEWNGKTKRTLVSVG